MVPGSPVKIRVEAGGVIPDARAVVELAAQGQGLVVEKCELELGALAAAVAEVAVGEGAVEKQALGDLPVVARRSALVAPVEGFALRGPRGQAGGIARRGAHFGLLRKAIAPPVVAHKKALPFPAVVAFEIKVVKVVAYVARAPRPGQSSGAVAVQPVADVAAPPPEEQARPVFDKRYFEQGRRREGAQLHLARELPGIAFAGAHVEHRGSAAVVARRKAVFVEATAADEGCIEDGEQPEGVRRVVDGHVVEEDEVLVAAAAAHVQAPEAVGGGAHARVEGEQAQGVGAVAQGGGQARQGVRLQVARAVAP